jgi:hypothetical protein
MLVFKRLTSEEIEILKITAKCRREALKKGGCNTFIIKPSHNHLVINCLCCGMISHNSKDIEYKYCNFCSEFHSDWNHPDYQASWDSIEYKSLSISEETAD